LWRDFTARELEVYLALNNIESMKLYDSVVEVCSNWWQMIIVGFSDVNGVQIQIVLKQGEQNSFYVLFCENAQCIDL